MTVIRVCGQAQVQASPDVASVILQIRAVERAADAAFDRAATSSRRLTELLDARSIPTSARATSSIRLARCIEWDGERQVDRGHAAIIDETITLSDAEMVSNVCADVASALPDTSISGPFWQCSHDHPAHSEARILAAKDGTQRAADYAAALGLRVIGIIDVFEPGTRTVADAPMQERGFALMSKDAGGAPDINAGLATITANVEITFDARA